MGQLAALIFIGLSFATGLTVGGAVLVEEIQYRIQTRPLKPLNFRKPPSYLRRRLHHARHAA